MVGSSMMTSCALRLTARAIATICRVAALKTPERPLDVDIDLEAPQDRGRLGIEAAPIDQAQAARLAPEKDVLGDAAQGHEVDLLIDGGDAGVLRRMRCREVDRPIRQGDLARILPVGAGQDLDHRRLAGAVLSDERHDLARRDLQGGVGQGGNAGEGLAHGPHGDERRHDRLTNAPPTEAGGER